MLEMCEARCWRISVRFGLRCERIGEIQHCMTDLARRSAKVQPEIGCNLIVAAATSTQLAAEFRSQSFEETTFKCGVHILIIGVRKEYVVLDINSQ